MRRARRADIDEIDVGPSDQLLVRAIVVRNLELFGERFRAIDQRIGDGDELAARIALVSRQVSEFCPGAGAEYSDANGHQYLRSLLKTLISGRPSR